MSGQQLGHDGRLFDVTQFGGPHDDEPGDQRRTKLLAHRRVGYVERVAGPFGVLVAEWKLSPGTGVRGPQVHAVARVEQDPARTLFACGRRGATLTAQAGTVSPACPQCVARAGTAAGG